MEDVLSVGTWKNNAELIRDVAHLYLDPAWVVLDATWGMGGFWKEWSPVSGFLVKADLYPLPGIELRADFRRLPFASGSLDAAVFDPPYRLNGTPDLGAFDDRYGIGEYVPWQERMTLILDGAVECGRTVRKGGILIVKIQDQVCSGKVVWQTDEVTAALAGTMQKVDRFDFVNAARKQPAGRKQVHARRNASQLLVFRKR